MNTHKDWTEQEQQDWNEEMVKKYDPDAFHNHPNPIIRFIEERRVRVLLRMLDPQPDSKVLDLGCGAGNVLERVPQGILFGYDLSPSMLEKARARMGSDTDLRQGDAAHLPYEDGMFDRVYCTEVLEHVPDPLEVVREMARVLAPDGKIVISVPYEKLINKIKWMLRYIRLDRVLRGSKNYSVPDDMTDEWHLRAFDDQLLRECTEPYLERIAQQGIPSRVLPLRWVASFRKRN
jgi:ubiquinone/menaquinone biosynthesis C-methylase UbiE